MQARFYGSFQRMRESDGTSLFKLSSRDLVVLMASAASLYLRHP